MAINAFEDLKWNESRWIDTALVNDEDDTALIVDVTEDYDNNRLLYWPTVNHKNHLRSLTPMSDKGLARRAAWDYYLKLLEAVDAAPPIDSVYVRTGSDGFVEELELL